jgi:hypothetical protein
MNPVWSRCAAVPAIYPPPSIYASYLARVPNGSHGYSGREKKQTEGGSIVSHSQHHTRPPRPAGNLRNLSHRDRAVLSATVRSYRA